MLTCAPESMAGTYVPVAAGVCVSTAANSPAAQAGTLVFLRRWGRVVFPAPPPPRPSPAWRGGGAAHPVGGRCERPRGGGGRNGGTPLNCTAVCAAIGRPSGPGLAATVVASFNPHVFLFPVGSRATDPGPSQSGGRVNDTMRCCGVLG